MGQNHNVDDLLREARALGLTVRPTAKQHHLVSGPGGTYLVSGTPSRWNAHREMARIRKLTITAPPGGNKPLKCPTCQKRFAAIGAQHTSTPGGRDTGFCSLTITITRHRTRHDR